MWTGKQGRECRKCTPRRARDDVAVANRNKKLGDPVDGGSVDVAGETRIRMPKNVFLESQRDNVAMAGGRKWDGAPIDGGGIDVKEKHMKMLKT